jgi:hypothetical protein
MKEFNVSVFNLRSSILPDLRCQAVDEALKAKASHMLFLDSDMTFPPQALLRLLDHDKEMVGANYCTKSETNPETVAIDLEGKRINPRSSQSLIPVQHVGLGVMLLKASVFNGLTKPFFKFTYNPDGTPRGEDWGFFRQVFKKHGLRPYVDQKLSHEVSHVGCFEFQYAHGAFNQLEDVK